MTELLRKEIRKLISEALGVGRIDKSENPAGMDSYPITID
jgi:hypothetical protein